jgi:putative transposase
MEGYRYFHVWFSTKGRKHILDGDVNERIKALFVQVAAEKGVILEEIETAWDHVHLLLSLTEDQPLAWAMKNLKGRVAYEMFKEVPQLKWDLHSNSLWQKSYGSREVLPSGVGAVRRYIRTQDQRPHRH